MNLELDTSLRAARMLQGGRVTITFRSPTGQHITLTAKCRAPQDNGKWGHASLADARIMFIEVPSAGDGWADKVGKVTGAGFTADRDADPARVWCAKQLLLFVAGKPMAAGLEAFEEDRCGCCGRPLTDPVSIERGIGPDCYGAMTGSQHETKVRPATPAAPPRPPATPRTPRALPVATIAPLADALEAAHMGASSGGTDKQGVPMGYGDWRARRKVLRAELDNTGTPRRVNPSYTEQMTTLPGTTWEDIFRPVAEAKGIVLP